MSELIHMRDLYKIYNPGANEVRALDGVHFHVGKGEFVAVVGQSGSGKSTLMNMIGLLDVPTFGEYRFEGVVVSGMDDRQLSDIRNRKIGFIFQSFNLISNLSAYDNVALPLIYRGIPQSDRKKLVLEALDRVGLSDRMRHKPSELSGGQQQRVAVARAIAGSPSLILADEPTGNLDSASGKQVFSIIKELHQSGKTIVLITHAEELARESDRMVRIADGKIVDEETSSQRKK